MKNGGTSEIDSAARRIARRGRADGGVLPRCRYRTFSQAGKVRFFRIYRCGPVLCFVRISDHGNPAPDKGICGLFKKFLCAKSPPHLASVLRTSFSCFCRIADDATGNVRRYFSPFLSVAILPVLSAKSFCQRAGIVRCSASDVVAGYRGAVLHRVALDRGLSATSQPETSGDRGATSLYGRPL